MLIQHQKVEITCFDSVYATISLNDFNKMVMILKNLDNNDCFIVTDDVGNLLSTESSFEKVSHWSMTYFNSTNGLCINGIAVSHHLISLMNGICNAKGFGFMPNISFRVKKKELSQPVVRTVMFDPQQVTEVPKPRS